MLDYYPELIKIVYTRRIYGDLVIWTSEIEAD